MGYTAESSFWHLRRWLLGRICKILLVGQSWWVMARMTIKTNSSSVAKFIAVAAKFPRRLGVVSILVVLSTILPIAIPVFVAVLLLSAIFVVVVLQSPDCCSFGGCSGSSAGYRGKFAAYFSGYPADYSVEYFAG